MTDKKIIFWWPDSIFHDVHWKKDPGSIPLELQNIGYDVTLIVGAFNVSKMHKIKTITTKKIKKKSKFGFIDRIMGVFIVLKATIKSSSNAVIIEHGEIETLLFCLLLRILRPNLRSLLILKLDADPEYLRMDNKHFLKILWRYILTRMFDKIICESQCAYDELVNLRQIKKYQYKFNIIPNGFYINQNDRNAENLERNKVILSVGRIAPQKGHDILIEIFNSVFYEFPDWNLRIVGATDDEKYMKFLKNKITNLKLNNSVSIITDLSDKDVVEEYKKASIFCLLSRYESFGISRIEAIHYGLPLVISEAGCGVQYKKFGSFVCNIENQKCVSEALSELIINKNLREKISERQKPMALEWKDVAFEFSKLIDFA